MSALSWFTRRYGGRRWFVLTAKAYVPLDRALSRLTRGRFVALGMRDVPSLLITTTGRRSGQPRANPLLYVPDGDAYVVIGSNFGRPHHPAWSNNLLANPSATVTLGGITYPVTAHLVVGPDRDRLEQKLRSIWPGYRTYLDRSDGREFRVFRLVR